jgi:hypothetical protein
MISAALREREPDDVLLSGFREILDGTLRQIRNARLPLGRLRRKGETRLLSNLILALRMAERRGVEALAALDADRPGAAVSHAVELCDALRDGVLSRDNSDDLDRELQGDGANGPSDALWSQAERHVEALQKSCSQLAETIVAISPSLNLKEPKVMSITDDSAVRQMSEIAAAVALLGGGTAPGRSSGRRFEAVSDQMAATLDSFGLPHEGVQLATGSNTDAARARLIAGLSRNFSSRERDGYRVYYRTDPQPFSRETYMQSPLLRGRGLVDANLLRAEADALLGIIDRLPSMARFQLVPTMLDGSAEREIIRRELDALVETARDPMGVNPPRAKFQLRRLNQAVGDHLDHAEITEVDGSTAQSRLSDALAAAASVEEQIDIMIRFRDEELCAPTSVVRDEEVRAELANLITLQASICHRLTVGQNVRQLGVAAARLEELLTAALASVDQLEVDLERSGTDIPEQDVQLEPERDSQTVRLSIGQFIRWVRSTALPYAGAENRAATLRRNHARLLKNELSSLSNAAKRFATSQRLGLSRPLPRIQLIELAGYLESAHDQARILAGEEAGEQQG